MKIEFEDRSYLEIKKTDSGDKVLITISAKDHLNPLKKITNSVDIDLLKFKELIASL